MFVLWCLSSVGLNCWPEVEINLVDSIRDLAEIGHSKEGGQKLHVYLTSLTKSG